MCSVSSLTGQTSFCLLEKKWLFYPTASLLCPITENWAFNPSKDISWRKLQLQSNYFMIMPLNAQNPTKTSTRKPQRDKQTPRKSNYLWLLVALNHREIDKDQLVPQENDLQPGSLWYHNVVTDNQLWPPEPWVSPFSPADTLPTVSRGSLASIWQHRRSPHLSSGWMNK